MDMNQNTFSKFIEDLTLKLEKTGIATEKVKN